MRKTFWIGILGIVTMIASASAQVPSECGGYFLGYDSCRFACQAGDYIAISGYGTASFPNTFDVSASCGGVFVSCSGSPCTAQSGTVVEDGENGSCQAGATELCVWEPYDICPGSGVYRCASVSPEQAAELEASGQGFVIQIPKQ
jgi:hypothetical protein